MLGRKEIYEVRIIIIIIIYAKYPDKLLEHFFSLFLALLYPEYKCQEKLKASSCANTKPPTRLALKKHDMNHARITPSLALTLMCISLLKGAHKGRKKKMLTMF